MGVCASLTGILNLITLLLSSPIIGAGIWLATQHITACYRFLQWPLLILGVSVLVVSVAGFVGYCCRVKWLLWTYLTLMFVIILVLVIFSIFTFIVTNKGAGVSISNKGWKEYHLGDSTWLDTQMSITSNWEKIRGCLSDAKVCDSVYHEYPTETALNRASLTPIQSGCCKPPMGCDCSLVNSTTWKSCKKSSFDSDCTTYNPASSDQCFGCNSCRAGVLQDLKQEWRKVGIINTVVVACLTIIYCVACCAFSNTKYARYFVKQVT